MQNAPCTRPSAPAAPAADVAACEACVPDRFAESLTADRVVRADDEAADRRVDKCAFLALDRYAGVVMAFPATHRDAECTEA